MQILFLFYIWKPHVIFNQLAQTDWQTTSLRKCLMYHQVSTLFSFPLWSKPIILHLCKYICAAHLFTCCWTEQTILHSFLVLHLWNDCIFPECSGHSGASTGANSVPSSPRLEYSTQGPGAFPGNCAHPNGELYEVLLSPCYMTFDIHQTVNTYLYLYSTHCTIGPF
jgi:hypothetical protein